MRNSGTIDRQREVLVAGGCGFIGSHLCDALLDRTDVKSVVCIDNLWTGTRENIDHIRDSRFSFVQTDVEHYETQTKFDEIYHLASPASPKWYMAEPQRTISANIVGAINLLRVMKEGGRFCFTSTSEVYGDPIVTPQPESYLGAVSCTGPRSSYDEGKRVTEALLFELRRTRNLDIRVVRLFNVYGPRTRVDDGRAISNFITQALSGQPLTIYGTGTQTRSWGYIDDIVDALARFFWRDPTDYPGPLNIGNNREISVSEVAQFIGKLTGTDRIQYLPGTPDDPTNRCPDLKLANMILPGWKCRIPYEEGTARTLDWFKKKMNCAPAIQSPETLK